ncbi:MAG: glycoside hydrolase family 13 [Chloroflexales bacterium]|nr:glycoside hydrolase family 13 [Chloroflexales bacterium]
MIIQLPIVGETVAVLFRLPASIWADRVHLVGDFNNWSTIATPMRRGEQYWEVTLTLTPARTYAYAYLLDGIDWCSDLNRAQPGAGVEPATVLLPVPVAHARHRVAAMRAVGGPAEQTVRWP